MNYTVKDSGERREFGTGAVRDMGGGKGRTDLLPFYALLEVSKHMEAGAEKYGDENWRKGIPLRVYLDSAVRHLFKLALGMRDERHDLAAAWNILCLIETCHMIRRGLLPPTLDNLPDFFNPPDSPIRPENREPLYTSTFSEGPIISDFRPVDELDTYLSAQANVEYDNGEKNYFKTFAEPLPPRCPKCRSEAEQIVMWYLEGEGQLPGGRGSYPPEIGANVGAFQQAIELVMQRGDPYRWADDFDCPDSDPDECPDDFDDEDGDDEDPSDPDPFDLLRSTSAAFTDAQADTLRQFAEQAERKIVARVLVDGGDGQGFTGGVPVRYPTITLREQDHYPPSTQSLARLVRTELDADALTPKLGRAVEAIRQDELREYDERQARREYTRGHADETAARFNAGLPYADDLMVAELPQSADVQAAADADVDEGEYAPLPSAGQIADVVDSEAATMIGNHPLFAVVYINGPDVAEYTGPEVCEVLPDNCGCGTQYNADDVARLGVFAVVRKPDLSDKRRWIVKAGKVYFAYDDSQPFREATVVNVDNIRDGILRGHFIIDGVGRATE